MLFVFSGISAIDANMRRFLFPRTGHLHVAIDARLLFTSRYRQSSFHAHTAPNLLIAVFAWVCTTPASKTVTPLTACGNRRPTNGHSRTAFRRSRLGKYRRSPPTAHCLTPKSSAPPPPESHRSSAHSTPDSPPATETPARACESESPPPAAKNPRHPAAYCSPRCESCAPDTTVRNRKMESRSCECRQAPAHRPCAAREVPQAQSLPRAQTRSTHPVSPEVPQTS